MHTSEATLPRNVLLAYYAATVLFLLLDIGLRINVRVAFLEPYLAWRGAYYGICLACLVRGCEAASRRQRRNCRYSGIVAKVPGSTLKNTQTFAPDMNLIR